MAANSRRMVFTGVGVLSAIGNEPMAFYDALLAGTSGVRPLQGFDVSTFPCRLAAEVLSYDGKKFLPASNRDAKKSLNKMARTVQFGFTTAVKAWEDANGPLKGQIDPFRFGVEYGCVMVATETEDLATGAKACTTGQPHSVDYDKWGREGLGLVPPQWMLKYLPNMPACHASIYTDAQGPNNTITAGDTASLLALGEAYRITQRNLADAFLVGGTDSRINPVSFSRHSSFQELSRQNELGDKALQPFGMNRSGTVLGEGCAVFVMEEPGFALQRGAKPLAELVGFASGFDRGLKGSVLANVIRRALAEAKIVPTDIDHVNANAGGWKLVDAWEARAIAEVFGPNMDVFAPKAHLGATGAAAGLLELAASILALKHGQLPGTLNAETPDPACPVRLTREPRPIHKPYALKISATNMGQCAVAVIKKA
ncbi:MAG: beta-ketoacyl-[acyl-carrier-protein] synthase family protein [Fimbriiglobus sp.]